MIDTDILVDYLRGRKEAKDFVMKLLESEEEILLSEVSEIELLSHRRCENPTERKKIEMLFEIFRKIEVNNEIGKLAGEIRRKFGLSFPDSIIAASCVLFNAKLVTRNVRDFKRVKGLEIVVPYS